MKVFTITKEEALAIAADLGKNYYTSSCDVLDLDYGATEVAEKVLSTAIGDTQCFRTDDGDIIGWWE